MPLSPLVPVVQHFPSNAIPDVAAAVRAELASRSVGSEFRPGARIAIGVGSRGIANLADIVRATVAHFRERGCEPFIVPAMGSHGGGTAAGQTKVLAQYGVTEADAGCPVRSQLETVTLGETPLGIMTYMDRLAYESDGVFLINRIKWHTTFEAPLESGLVKMAAIGLGKLQGATDYHRHAVRLGFGPVIESAGRHVLASGKILGGLALLEDAHHQISHVEAIPASAIPEREAALLQQAKASMARLPFDEIDILIVDEIGKQISGVGMDSKVINRHPYGAVNPWNWVPRILRIYVRTISPMSYGNANGMGMADMISERLHAAVDWNATKVNALTASNLPSIRTPLVASSDREAIEVLAASVGRLNPDNATCVWIRNTLELSHFLVTENLLDSARPHPSIDVVGAPKDWAWATDGNLLESFDNHLAAFAAKP